MPSKSAFFRDGKIAPNSALDIGNASNTNKDFDPTINTDSTLNKHTKVPVSSPPPFTYDRSPLDLTQTANSIGLSDVSSAALSAANFHTVWHSSAAIWLLFQR